MSMAAATAPAAAASLPSSQPLFPFPSPSEIARAALHHYHKALPSCGKPQRGKEWTCYSAIVAASASAAHQQRQDRHQHDVWVISASTGSKCVSVTAASDALPCLPDGDDDDDNGDEEDASKAHQQRSAASQDGLHRKEIRGAVLHDSHAEVLARRGLLRVLWAEIEINLKGKQFIEGYKPLLQRKTNGTDDEKKVARNQLFELRPDLTLHFYVSDSPCGDASIYEIMPKYRQQQETTERCDAVQAGNNDTMVGRKRQRTELSFTGAKIIVSDRAGISTSQLGYASHNDIMQCSDSLSLGDGTSSTIVARERDDQVLGALRSKSGRSNLPSHLRSTSMSCSDKLCRWCVLGMQGALLSRYIPDPISPASVVVSRDPRCDKDSDGQRIALDRAISKRAEQVLHLQEGIRPRVMPVPVVHVVGECFGQGKANAEKAEVDMNGSSLVGQNDRDEKPISSKRKHEETLDTAAATATAKNSRKKMLSPCGFCVNWQRLCTSVEVASSRRQVRRGTTGADIELVIGAKGTKQGKKPKKPKDVRKVMSRLCRWNLAKSAIYCDSLVGGDFMFNKAATGYNVAKGLASKAVTGRKALCMTNVKSPLCGWVRSVAGDFIMYRG